MTGHEPMWRVRRRRPFAPFLLRVCVCLVVWRIRPCLSQAPEAKSSDNNATDSPTPSPTTSASATADSSAATLTPSLGMVENLTLAPSVAITASPMPTVATIPDRSETLPTSDNTSNIFSNASEATAQPSSSANDTNSFSNSTMSAPPTSRPTTSMPSQTPSARPSPMPSISMAPTSMTPSYVPTTSIQIIESPFLSMTLLGMERNVQSSEDFLQEWRKITSQHVLQFWSSYNERDEKGPLQVERVITHLQDEVRISNDRVPLDERLPTATMIDAADAADTDNEYRYARPDLLKITYKQEIYVHLPGNLESEYPDLTRSNIFTIPFELDGQNFTEALRGMTNSSHLVFLQYDGVVDDPTALTVSSKQGKKIITIVVTVVTLSLIAASSYIFYLMRVKEQHQRERHKDTEEHSPDKTINKAMTGATTTAPLVGSFIGISVNDKVLVSESYEDDGLDAERPVAAAATTTSALDGASSNDPESALLMDAGSTHLQIPPTDNALAHPLLPLDEADDDGAVGGSRFVKLESFTIYEQAVADADPAAAAATSALDSNQGFEALVHDEVNAPVDTNADLPATATTVRDHLSTEDSPFPSLPFTVSDVESGEMSDYYVINYSTDDQNSYHSSSSLGSGGGGGHANNGDALLHLPLSAPSSPATPTRLPPPSSTMPINTHMDDYELHDDPNTHEGLEVPMEHDEHVIEFTESYDIHQLQPLHPNSTELLQQQHDEDNDLALHNPFLQSGFQIEIRDLE